MKTRTSIHAGVGPQGCSPETQHFMRRALDMQRKVENCLNQGNYFPPNNNWTNDNPSIIGGTYPDRSGICG